MSINNPSETTVASTPENIGASHSENTAASQYDNMTPAEFEQQLPELFAAGNVSGNPALQTFLARNPDCAALVRDLETIAETARQLLEPAVAEPSDDLWSKIASKLPAEPVGDEPVDMTE